jgi:hypothetical protein
VNGIKKKKLFLSKLHSARLAAPFECHSDKPLYRNRIARWYIPVFSNQKSQFGKKLGGLAMEEVGIFYDIWSIVHTGIFVHNFMTIWYILLVNWYIFPMLYQPCAENCRHN